MALNTNRPGVLPIGICLPLAILLAVTIPPAAGAAVSDRFKPGLFKTGLSSHPEIPYSFYSPRNRPRGKTHILVCVPGLFSGGPFFDTIEWRRFADRAHFVLIAPTFDFDEEEWKHKRSYQYPQAWAGQALIGIVAQVAHREGIGVKPLFLFGHSAGAQFVHRFALWKPEMCQAVALHAPGEVTLPDRPIRVRFFVGVGQADEERLPLVQQFAEACNKLGIPAFCKIYSGKKHDLYPEQIRDSQEFFMQDMDPPDSR